MGDEGKWQTKPHHVGCFFLDGASTKGSKEDYFGFSRATGRYGLEHPRSLGNRCDPHWYHVCWTIQSELLPEARRLLQQHCDVLFGRFQWPDALTFVKSADALNHDVVPYMNQLLVPFGYRVDAVVDNRSGLVVPRAKKARKSVDVLCLRITSLALLPSRVSSPQRGIMSGVSSASFRSLNSSASSFSSRSLPRQSDQYDELAYPAVGASPKRPKQSIQISPRKTSPRRLMQAKPNPATPTRTNPRPSPVPLRAQLSSRQLPCSPIQPNTDPRPSPVLLRAQLSSRQLPCSPMPPNSNPRPSLVPMKSQLSSRQLPCSPMPPNTNARPSLVPMKSQLSSRHVPCSPLPPNTNPRPSFVPTQLSSRQLPCSPFPPNTNPRPSLVHMKSQSSSRQVPCSPSQPNANQRPNLVPMKSQLSSRQLPCSSSQPNPWAGHGPEQPSTPSRRTSTPNSPRAVSSPKPTAWPTPSKQKFDSATLVSSRPIPDPKAPPQSPKQAPLKQQEPARPVLPIATGTVAARFRSSPTTTQAPPCVARQPSPVQPKAGLTQEVAKTVLPGVSSPTPSALPCIPNLQSTDSNTSSKNMKKNPTKADSKTQGNNDQPKKHKVPSNLLKLVEGLVEEIMASVPDAAKPTATLNASDTSLTLDFVFAPDSKANTKVGSPVEIKKEKSTSQSSLQNLKSKSTTTTTHKADHDVQHAINLALQCSDRSLTAACHLQKKADEYTESSTAKTTSTKKSKSSSRRSKDESSSKEKKKEKSHSKKSKKSSKKTGKSRSGCCEMDRLSESQDIVYQDEDSTGTATTMELSAASLAVSLV